MELSNEVVNYLKGLAGGKLVLTPEQLEPVIGISVKQQCKLRKKGAFPIPHKNAGKSIYYSIFHVADFLLSGEVSIPVKNKPSTTLPESPIKRKSSKDVQDLSHLFRHQ